MSRRVVDTCVAVVANGRNTHASVECQLACVEFLEALVQNGTLYIDQEGKILSEYDGKLRPQGQPGVGDRFYRFVLDNQGTTNKVRKVNTDAPRGAALRDAFQSGDLRAFDPSDRVFALCSAIARVPVSTAIDSDWPEHERGLQACGVQIEYVCGRDVAEAGGVGAAE